MNDIVHMLKNENEVMTPSVKDKLSRIIPKIIAGSSSVVTLMDSYKNAGIIGELLSTLVRLFGN